MRVCCYVPTSYDTSWGPDYLLDGIIDAINVYFADFADTMFFLCSVVLFINYILSEVSTILADELEATLAFVYSVEFEQTEAHMAKLTLISFVALVDPLVNKLFDKHDEIIISIIKFYSILPNKKRQT